MLRDIGQVQPIPFDGVPGYTLNTGGDGDPGFVAPPPVVQATNAVRVRGVFQFDGQSQQELSFMPGDILTVLDKQGDWWFAELRGRTGLIPSNYVEQI